MASKRTPINRRQQHKIRTPEMLAKVTRLVELMEDHHLALTDATPENMKFYDDGRHQELVDLSPQVTIPFGIHPHEDELAILRAMLAEANGEPADGTSLQ